MSSQTRRTVSFSAMTYVRIWLHCRRQRRSLAGWLDEVANAALDAVEAPTPSRAQAVQALREIRAARTMDPREGLAWVEGRMSGDIAEPFHSGNGHTL
jgi:hypothetical protein